MKRRSNRSKFQGHKAPETVSSIKPFLKPRVIIFGLVVSYFIVSLISITSFVLQNPFVEAPDWYFSMAMQRPFILLLGALCVLIERSWSPVAAVILVGFIIYSNTYRAFVGISNAHDVSMVSIAAVQIWFQIISAPQLIHTALAIAIAATGITQLARRFNGWLHHATTPRKESPTIS